MFFNESFSSCFVMNPSPFLSNVANTFFRSSFCGGATVGLAAEETAVVGGGGWVFFLGGGKI
jgi:hypothetical protein